MCFFKKKKKYEIVKGKYDFGEFVLFPYKGEVAPGVIYGTRKDSEGNIIYSIQIGGECPVIVSNIREEDVIPQKTAQKG